MSATPSDEALPTYEMIVRRVYERFPRVLPGAQHRSYAKWKLKTDPLYETVRQELKNSDLPILDIGCGVGILAFYLRESGLKMPIHGVDFDATKIKSAKKVAAQYDLPPDFEVGDMCKAWPAVCGHVCLLDVLQYLEVEDRNNLLARAVSHVAPGGVLIIRGSLKEPTWRWRFNVFMDRVANFATWMKTRPETYPTHDELNDAVSAGGLRLRRAEPLWGRTPFNMHLLVFERPLSGATRELQE